MSGSRQYSAVSRQGVDTMRDSDTAKPAQPQVAAWRYSQAHRETVRILEVQSLWGHTTCQVWVPSKSLIEWVEAESLTEPRADQDHLLDQITYKACAVRIADALAQDVLLAPLEAGVIPLPHQLLALSRAVSDGRVRYLLADEVGLGKTIEAGLIIRELKLRGLVKCTRGGTQGAAVAVGVGDAHPLQ
jgi:hypothetical protein